MKSTATRRGVLLVASVVLALGCEVIAPLQPLPARDSGGDRVVTDGAAEMSGSADVAEEATEDELDALRAEAAGA